MGVGQLLATEFDKKTAPTIFADVVAELKNMSSIKISEVE